MPYAGHKGVKAVNNAILITQLPEIAVPTNNYKAEFHSTWGVLRSELHSSLDDNPPSVSFLQKLAQLRELNPCYSLKQYIVKLNWIDPMYSKFSDFQTRKNDITNMCLSWKICKIMIVSQSISDHSILIITIPNR